MALWDRISSRGNVEDRRGLAPIVGGLSLTGVALLLLFNYLAGGDLTDVLSELNTIPLEKTQMVDTAQFEGADSYEVFASTVLGSNNDMWTVLFNQMGKTYTAPRLVLYRTATESACGTASSQVGPHYCPLDKTIYLDETFFEELQTRFGAQGGDVAEAYVIAHEAAHHAQNELGIMNEVNELGQNVSQDSNQLSVKMELQADCFAGLWAYSVKDLGVFLPGELAEAIDAAAAVGDDRIQEKVAGYTNPETWTHGSSEQRVGWFNKGLETGNFAECDTFSE